jgi:hypothetical protein
MRYRAVSFLEQLGVGDRVGVTVDLAEQGLDDVQHFGLDVIGVEMRALERGFGAPAAVGAPTSSASGPADASGRDSARLAYSGSVATQ